jgi:hypothetical protein
VLDFPVDDLLTVCLDEGVPIMATFWGDPSRMTARIRGAGALHLHTVGEVAEAVYPIGSTWSPPPGWRPSTPAASTAAGRTRRTAHCATRPSEAGKPPVSRRHRTGPAKGDVVAVDAAGQHHCRYDDQIPLPGMTGDLGDMHFTRANR